MEKINIGYLSSLKIEDQYIGGLLVTDIRAVPMEFKYTDPIQPTDNQKVMYGEVLDKTIHEEVIRANLLKAVKKVPSIILAFEKNISRYQAYSCFGHKIAGRRCHK